MSRKGRKGKGEAELVECEECKRWCNLEETNFESLADAVGKVEGKLQRTHVKR